MALIIYYAIALFIVVLDLLTKKAALASEVLLRGDTIDIIPGVLRINLTYNEGAAMGMLSDNRWVFMSLSTVAIIGLLVGLAVFHKKLGKMSSVAFAFFIGGGIGNMVERLLGGEVLGKGRVTDFIDFYAFPKLWTWIFNFADVFVCVGAGLFALSVILDEVKSSRLAREEKASAITVSGADSDAADNIAADDASDDFSEENKTEAEPSNGDNEEIKDTETKEEDGN